MKKLNPGFKQFLWKTGIFLFLFLAISFTAGKVIYKGLLNDFYVYIYGGMGYILLFSIAGFILLYRERLFKFNKYSYKLTNILFVVISLLLTAIFYYIGLNVDEISRNIINIALIHLLVISIFGFLLVGVYGFRFIKEFFREFKKELLYFLIFGAIVYSLMNSVWKLWPYFSWLVLKINAFLFDILHMNYKIIEPRIINVNGFAAEIGEACSGVYSIFLFTALYLFIILLDWKKMNKKKAALLFIPAVAGAFLTNVFRVFSIFMFGGFISKDVAIGLYHSYIGMLFFLIYFAFFWILFYKWMKDEPGLYKKYIQDSLYRNSIFLMLSTLIMASLGFIFWMIAARLFSTENVGLATAIISVMGIITSFSALGLGSGLIHFLPKSKRKNKKINTCFTLIALVTIIITSIFLILISNFSQKLHFIKENLILSIIFIIFMIFASFNSLIESVFIAYRSTKYILLKNFIFSSLKILLLFAFVSLGAYGIFSSWMIAIITGFIISIIVLMYKFNYKIKAVFYDNVIKRIGKYSFGNYAAGFIGGLPVLILPLIIISKLQAEFSAYYYIAMMIANLLFAIPSAASNSLFAEGSTNENKINEHVKKAGKIIALLLIPAIIIVVLFGKYILLFFGQNYSSEGFKFLQLLALSGAFVSVNSVFGAIFRIRHRIKEIIYISIIGAIITIGLSYYLLHLGLIGIGLAWIISQGVVSLGYLVLWLIRKESEG